VELPQLLSEAGRPSATGLSATLIDQPANGAEFPVPTATEQHWPGRSMYRT
jgi:hypothetical protein